jgi:hypothetical protein
METKWYGTIRYAEFFTEDMTPFSVQTTKDTYDFVESKSAGRLFSGGGGDLPHLTPGWKFWAAPDREVTTWDNKLQQTRPLTEEENSTYRMAELPFDPFENTMEAEGGIGCCTICDDWMDRDDTCQHLFWGSTGMTGPGYSEEVEPGSDCKGSFLALVKECSIAAALKLGLVPFKLRLCFTASILGVEGARLYVGDELIKDLMNHLDPYDEGEVSLSDGASWLRSLDENTVKANAMTLKWLEESDAKPVD